MSDNINLKETTKQCFRQAMIAEATDKKETVTMIMPPNNEDSYDLGKMVFLTGTIDGGKSDNWQRKFYKVLKEKCQQKITIFNPRRDEWPDNHSSEVRNQIRWEHEHLDKADIIVMNILPDSKSPITLMEMGMFAESGKLMVFCQKDFYRYDNVDMVCKRYNIPLYNHNNIDKMVDAFLSRIKK